MSSGAARRAAPRARLAAQAEAQRAGLARQLQPWRARLALLDRGEAALRQAARHPVLLGLAGGLLLALLRPRRVTTWLLGGQALWRVARRLRGD